MYPARPIESAIATARKLLGLPPKKRAGSHATGRIDGFPVTFYADRYGWKVAVGGVTCPVTYEVRDAMREDEHEQSLVPGAAFRVGYVVDGAPADSVRAALAPELCTRIQDLAVTSITLRRGKLEMDKYYTWFYGQPEDVEAGMTLAIDLARAALRAPLPQPRPEVQSFGGPYRGEASPQLDVDASMRAELTAYTRRLRKRGRRETARNAGRALLYCGLLVMWPIGVVVWAYHVRKRDRQRDRLLAAARDDSANA